MKTRDAERSRESILDAAEDLFSHRGFHGCSLADIGSACGLSRATPSYFFGSKEKLYKAVLERVFAARQSETEQAVKPILEWCEQEGTGRDQLEAAIGSGIERYMGFLLARPSFGRLIYWEELDGGTRLRAAERNSTALADAFERVLAVRQRDGSAFEVRDAVILWVSLAFLPATLATTFVQTQGLDLTKPAQLKRHARLAASQLTYLIYGGS